MFNLIISIIAIALVISLAGASLYYGGKAFSDGKTDATAAMFVNHAEQLKSASTLYMSIENSNWFNHITLVNEGYLSNLPKPKGFESTINTNGIWRSRYPDNHFTFGTILKETNKGGITLETCQRINEVGNNIVYCVELAVPALMNQAKIEYDQIKLGTINSPDENTPIDTPLALIVPIK